MDITQKQNELPVSSGMLITKRRKDRNMTRGELAQVTNISLRDIEYLEADDYVHLPAPVYVRGFLDRCAFALDMPPVDLLSVYKKREDDFGKKNYIKKLYVDNQLIVTPKIIFIAMTLFVGAAIGFYFWYQLNYLLASPFLIVTSPENDIIITENFTPVTGRTQRESRLFINSQEVVVSVNGVFNNTFALQEGINTIEIKSINKFGSESVLTRRIIKR